MISFPGKDTVSLSRSSDIEKVNFPWALFVFGSDDIVLVLVVGVTNDGDVLCCSEGQAELSGVSSNVTPSTSLDPDRLNTTDISQIIMGI